MTFLGFHTIVALDMGKCHDLEPTLYSTVVADFVFSTLNRGSGLQVGDRRQFT